MRTIRFPRWRGPWADGLHASTQSDGWRAMLWSYWSSDGMCWDVSTRCRSFGCWLDSCLQSCTRQECARDMILTQYGINQTTTQSQSEQTIPLRRVISSLKVDPNNQINRIYFSPLPVCGWKRSRFHIRKTNMYEGCQYFVSTFLRGKC